MRRRCSICTDFGGVIVCEMAASVSRALAGPNIIEL